MTREEMEKYTTLDTDQCKWWVNHLFNIAKEKAFNANVMDDAKEIQSAQDKIIKVLEQESKWIPVSERLPKDRRIVLVTAYWHETYQVMMASYFGDGLWYCVPYNNCGEHMQTLKPKAWMPLPEPYKSEVSE